MFNTNLNFRTRTDLLYQRTMNTFNISIKKKKISNKNSFFRKTKSKTLRKRLNSFLNTKTNGILLLNLRLSERTGFKGLLTLSINILFD